MSRKIEPIRILDQTSDVHLFTLQLEWLQNDYECLLKGMMPKKFITSQKQYLTKRAKPFVLQEGILYWFGQDNKFHKIL